jgi:hypothetical protein
MTRTQQYSKRLLVKVVLLWWGVVSEDAAPLIFNQSVMEAIEIKSTLDEFHGTTQYHKHLYPGRPAIMITDGCKFIRDDLKAYWLFDAILSYQNDLRKRNVNFQVWELKQLRKDLSWLLTCREDKGLKLVVSQRIEYSDFPLDYIKIWVIDKVVLLPSEY